LPVTLAAALLARHTMAYVWRTAEVAASGKTRGLLNKIRQPGSRVSVIQEASSLRIGSQVTDQALCYPVASPGKRCCRIEAGFISMENPGR
jgi:hypothetical protein